MWGLVVVGGALALCDVSGHVAHLLCKGKDGDDRTSRYRPHQFVEGSRFT